jgi:hypothetical protein
VKKYKKINENWPLYQQSSSTVLLQWTLPPCEANYKPIAHAAKYVFNAVETCLQKEQLATCNIVCVFKLLMIKRELMVIGDDTIMDHKNRSTVEDTQSAFK